MNKYKLPFFVLLLGPSFLGAQTAGGAKADYEITKADLEKSLQTLSQVRREVEMEKIPLAKELGQLDGTAVAKRKEADHVKRLRDNQEVDLNSRVELIQKLRNDNGFVSAALGDYIRVFESKIHVSERQLYKDKLARANAALEDINLSDKEKLKLLLEAVDTAFERLDRSIGGDVFEGKAVTPDGNYEDGTFVVVGPLAFFSSSSGQVGLPTLELTSENPIINSISKHYEEGITSLANTREGVVPVDSTLGDAFKIEATRETRIEEIKKGGIVMYPILGLATFAFIVAIFKWFDINKVKLARAKDLRVILQYVNARETEKAVAYAKSVKGPAGELLLAAVDNAGESKELIEEILYEKLLAAQPKLERMLPLIALTAATAPLFGLLGTVTGMIKTFNLITVFGTGDASNLSAGISEALITTKYGLIIAIPALIFHTMLSRKAKDVLSAMEQTAIGFLNGLKIKN